ncbi:MULTISPECIES: NADAR family protein [Pseudoalteromonas]|uniref:NADAR family protein n=1 Tax=Pseudoalteromonas obscura TaxID=3048491 RepID=A0ABT7EG78_9GAMM|nr:MULTISPECIES: NADAR family protein [Pseudoalteromonas]MDK2594002.1 NADAR family protein [Pseudoalteromonas sp. P94(2023)]
MKVRTKDKLADFVNQGNKVEYVFFWGHQEKSGKVSKSCFSQWYESTFQEDGNEFLTAEHYMMYHKAKLFGDHDACEKVLCAHSPAKAKAIGREVLGFEQNLWDEKRFEIVVNANLAKFSQNAGLEAFLLNTGNRVIVEASPVDKIWGIGLAQDNPACENPNSWKGLNLLGFALMEVRARLADKAGA